MGLPYKVATLLYCFNESDETLLLERVQEPNRGLWSPCGGKLHTDVGESPYACACREAQEELGLVISPFDLHLTRDRVSDEAAPITFLAPEHLVLNKPNRITNADFDGWVQERGVYFADRWDERFTPVLACSDTGESPLKGGLLVASCGKGHFVYTGLAFFRQLPEGAPGAFRLFANLVSLGK